MNWGHKITIVILTFIIGMLGMVYVASKQTNEMFDSNYYEKELKYQNYINASNNLQALNTKIVVTQTTESLIITFPSISISNINEGKIELLKADDSKKDLSQKMNSSAQQIIKKSDLSSGLYTARIFWINNNTPYYFEQKINIVK